MDKRMVEFVSALRANGARVSLAESADSIRAIQEIGILDREMFKMAIRSTLVKDKSDVETFERLFPDYFGSDGPPLMPPQGLNDEQMQQLMDAINELRQQLREIMEMLAKGEMPSKQQLDQYAKQAGISRQMRGSEQIQQWLTDRMMRQMQLTPEQLKAALEALLKQLKEQGMDAEGRQEVRETVQGNAEAMREQVRRYVGQSMNRKPEEYKKRERVDDLMDRPLSSLSDAEKDELRAHVRRLVSRLRSRAALRMRKANRIKMDVRSTIRFNQRYGGVPLELKHKRRVLKPKLTVVVDVSTSMRPVAEFMLLLMYEMQDQVSKARSFAFIGELEDVSMIFNEHRPEKAVPIVLKILPPGSYSTDLGHCLNTLCRDHADAVDHRTTLIFVGDGRNNFNDPRTDLVQQLKLRARRVIWMTPEPTYLWRTGDSDMHAYAPLCDAVHEVATLQQLADAIDDLFIKAVRRS